MRFKFFLFFLIALIGLGFFVLDYTKPLGGSAKILYLKKGTGIQAIAKQLENQGIIHRPDQFFIPALTTYRQGFMRFKAGEYEVTPNMSPLDVITMLVHGKTLQRKFQILEGARSFEILKEINENPYFEGPALTRIDEGSLFPDTYFYERGDKRAAVLAKIKIRMDQTLEKLWAQHQPQSLLKSSYEALILASIVEKEAQLPEERPLIAAVFLNRLAIDMKLDACSSVLYALGLRGIHKNFLIYADLKLESPFNTYINKGLPPAPIAMPGAKALEAALNPAKVPYLYFVVNGKGGHVFAANYGEHLQNVQKSRVFNKQINSLN